MPLYLVDNYDGWVSREVIDMFVKFSKICFERYEDLVKYWLTFNEIDSVFRHPFTTVGNLKGGLKNPNLEATPWGWQIDPTGLRILCNRMSDRYHKPLFILENGIGMIETLNEENTVHDDYRIEYLKEHLRALKLAINDGCDIIGYTWWGPMDVVSSGTSEMSKRYGFVYVDQDDEGNGSHKRYKKDSFNYYKHIIETDGDEL